MPAHIGIRLLATTLISIVALAPAALGGPSEHSIAYTTLASGQTSSIRAPEQVVIRDRATWRVLWRKHAGGSETPVPEVDFAHEMIIAIFGGESTAPKRLSITRIIKGSDHLNVWYTLGDSRPPVDGDGLAQIAPFHIVRLARSPMPVRFSLVKGLPIAAPRR